MKSVLLSLSFMLCWGCAQVLAQSDVYSRLWSDVYRYEMNEQTKSALKVVDSLYNRAKRDKNIPQVTRALLYQSKFALTLQEDAELHIVQKFKKEIAVSKAPLRNILESLLADIYWQYFQQNRWKYYDRSRTETKVNEDFRTWDADAMFKEIHHYLQHSMQDVPQLTAISLASLNDIILQGEGSRLYRPTVYDLIAHNALDFYTSGESGLSKYTRPMYIKDIRYFNEFESMTIHAPDSSSTQLQALKIYQALLRFHKTAKDTSAYIDLEVDRLNWIATMGIFENATDLHMKALEQLRSVYQKHPASTLVDFAIASIFYADGNNYKPEAPAKQFKKREAVNVCNQAIARFPASDGAQKCLALKNIIRHPHLDLRTELYIPVNTPSRIRAEYTNTNQLSCKAFAVTEEFLYQFRNMEKDSLRLTALEKITPTAAWQANLRDLHDYQEHSTEIVVPKLPPSKYILLAQVPADSATTGTGTFAYAIIQVTNLALLENISQDAYRYQVVDRNNGKPINGADVQLLSTGNDNSTPIILNFTTDKNGFFEIKKDGHDSYQASITVNYQQDHADFGGYYIYGSYNQNNDKEELTARSFMFSDRSIYRPGQIVYFKGILIKTKGKKSTVAPGEYVEVFLEDVNGKEVGSLRLKTNAFGSFSGEFKLPASGLTGEYSLYADEDSEDTEFYDDYDFDYQTLEISVEEYKRPTFEASFKPVKEIFRVKDTVTVKGTAISFSGAKVGGAKVNYRVKRTVRYTRWYNRYESGEDDEIAIGETITDKSGEFSINFPATPSESSTKEDRPVFEYQVTADVIDINGETRSTSTTVRVGYHTLSATLQAATLIDRKIPENTITVVTENLNGEFIPAQGTVYIYKLQSPETPVRPRPWTSPDTPSLSEEEFKALFPHDSYKDQSDPSKWEKGKLMFSAPFNTAKSKEVKFKTNTAWPLGRYVMELTSTDAAGMTINDRHTFTVFETGSRAVADNQLLLLEADKSSYRVGDLAKIKIGSAAPDIYVTVCFERNNTIVKTFTEHLSASTTTFTIPVTEGLDEGFVVHVSAAVYNVFLSDNEKLSVTSERKHIEIETATFKDKLQPDSRQMWSFTIKGDESSRKEAEVLASMYDASLDQFKPHAWSFNPIQEKRYYSSYRTNSSHSFGTTAFTLNSRVIPYRSRVIPHQQYDHFEWFGFNITNSHYTNRQYLSRLYIVGPDPANPSKVSMANSRQRKEGYIYGIITDSNGNPLPGVNIVVKGTVTGTTTDADGSYIVEAGKDDILIYSFIGYATAEATVGRKNTINVLMEEEVMALSEVVVTGYGTTVMKREMVGSQAMVVETTQESDVVFASLGGKTAGVQITNMPGGGNARIVIRGASTLNGDAKPLYVIDGVIVESSQIDQSDLENIQVLKGADATALYGARAANGVIIISTKSGQKKMDEELAKVNARKNFNETAFFFPHLTTDDEGKIQFTFTTPESLTRWKLQLLAHTKNLLTTTKTLQAVTQKELMVTPNAPRFLRVNDEITFSVKIANLSGKTLNGKIALQLSNAITGASADQAFGNIVRNQTFRINAKGNTEVSWRLKVPAGIDAVQYKVVAKAGNFSDGEQNALPVLSNRILVTESLPMYVRSGQTKTFTLDKLRTTHSPTLQHHQLTLEVTSNPAWYAIQALPYLMEFPHECAEQTFSRFYANALATHILNSTPKIKEVFNQWSSSGALISNLEKSPELKSIIIQETPWLRDAESETEQKKRVALLFDLNTMKDQWQSTINKLKEMQMGNGGFPWFSGSREASTYITQHIASSYGHLKHLNVVTADNAASDMMRKAVKFLDQQIVRDYNELQKTADNMRIKASSPTEGNRLVQEYISQRNIYNHHVHYLYMRSFFPDIPFDWKTQEAVHYYKTQSAQYWLDFNLYSKGMIALIQHRDQNTTVSKNILRSLKENSIVSEELGMYWKENKAGWFWYEAPVETQALLIEAFAEIDPQDIKTVDELRVWLLKNKQTSQWKTTKETTEAVYALLLTGTDWLPIDKQVDVTVGNKKITPDAKQTEAGTGYFKRVWKENEVTPAMGEVTLAKKDDGIAWAGLYWQYFEDLDKITPAATPLALSKKVFLVKNTDTGELLTEVNVNQPLEVGALLRIRIELKADRPMEFLHMKDLRAAGLEPVDVLSTYKWQEGLGYYQSTKDASTNFFFDNMQQGIYVFEYDLRVTNKGNFSNGITTIQSMYAPEFSSHSEGTRIVVK
ncbi:MAG TPA: carboxypeptidase-like regulatory domain-containing protein [Ohtaekwangia sp.]|uniref:alpha-2-macroglobulin family protein n=1 Tax=Ohtaekwangia sp. TaxID=2066019 RepID=UPI002F92B7B3